jgi:hypothetical protein
MAQLCERSAAAAHRHPLLRDPLLDRAEPALKLLQAALLGKPLGLAGIPRTRPWRPPARTARRDRMVRQARLSPARASSRLRHPRCH